MESYDAIVRCAVAACATTMAGFSTMDGRRIGNAPLTPELCLEIFAASNVLAIEDILTDGRFAETPLAACGARFFAAVAVRDSAGALRGALAVAETNPRSLSPDESAQLRDLACVAAGLLALEDRGAADRNLRLLSQAMDEALDLVLITDSTPPSRGGPFIQYANTTFLRATGYELDEIIGKPYGFLIAENNEPLVLETILRNIEAERENEKEIRIRRKDGSTFWIEFTGKPLYDGDDEDPYWVSVGRDITLRRQTHEQLAALTTAIDAVSGHLEIYTLDNGQYRAAFQNGEADSDISELVETLLNHPSLREATGLRARLKAGENVTVTNDGLQIRPLGKNAETLIAIKQRAS
jgi:PAS domain S-box-containing protein